MFPGRDVAKKGEAEQAFMFKQMYGGTKIIACMGDPPQDTGREHRKDRRRETMADSRNHVAGFFYCSVKEYRFMSNKIRNH